MKWLIVISALAIASPTLVAADDAVHPGPLILLDPGHGGSNTGAPSVRDGIYEKTITLAVARRVRDKLVARNIRVMMTRDGDRELNLRERSRLANELSADLFLSIHANASVSHSKQGFETYVLTADGLEVDAAALRAGDGKPRVGVPPQVAAMLDDLERGLSVPGSLALARLIQAELAEARGTGLDRGVRQDSMHVLLGAVMPAALVEIGFVDHPVEGRDLLDPDTQERIAEALARAVERAVR